MRLLKGKDVVEDEAFLNDQLLLLDNKQATIRFVEASLNHGSTFTPKGCRSLQLPTELWFFILDHLERDRADTPHRDRYSFVKATLAPVKWDSPVVPPPRPLRDNTTTTTATTTTLALRCVLHEFDLSVPRLEDPELADRAVAVLAGCLDNDASVRAFEAFLRKATPGRRDEINGLSRMNIACYKKYEEEGGLQAAVEEMMAEQGWMWLGSPVEVPMSEHERWCMAEIPELRRLDENEPGSVWYVFLDHQHKHHRQCHTEGDAAGDDDNDDADDNNDGDTPKKEEKEKEENEKEEKEKGSSGLYCDVRAHDVISFVDHGFCWVCKGDRWVSLHEYRRGHGRSSRLFFESEWGWDSPRVPCPLCTGLRFSRRFMPATDGSSLFWDVGWHARDADAECRDLRRSLSKRFDELGYDLDPSKVRQVVDADNMSAIESEDESDEDDDDGDIVMWSQVNHGELQPQDPESDDESYEVEMWTLTLDGESDPDSDDEIEYGSWNQSDADDDDIEMSDASDEHYENGEVIMENETIWRVEWQEYWSRTFRRRWRMKM